MMENGLFALYDPKDMTKGKPVSLDRLSKWLRDGLERIAESMVAENIWFEEFERLTDAMLA